MFRIDEYIDELTDALKDVFGKRLVYIGLQGSYLSNEETNNSDIDIMAVIATFVLFKQRQFCSNKIGIA